MRRPPIRFLLEGMRVPRPLWAEGAPPPMQRFRPLALITILALVSVIFTASPAAARTEQFVYHWELRKLAALFGGLLLPGEGEGRLTFASQGEGRLLAELLITSEHSEEGEFWRYGAEIDTEDGQTLKAWSSYVWRGKQDSDSAEIDEGGVIDIASGIYRIRRTLPERPRAMRIWSNGKIYPVIVTPEGIEERKLPGGERVRARHFRVSGLEEPDARFWKGHLDLWFAMDDAATPVEIRFDRSLLGVQLRLVSSTVESMPSKPSSDLQASR